jgi:hypothetical protein
MGDHERYLEIGTAIGAIAAVISFVVGYIYCIAAYGFLLGLGLGWLPSLILSSLIFVALRWLWAPIAACLCLGVVVVIVAANWRYKTCHVDETLALMGVLNLKVDQAARKVGRMAGGGV